MRSWSARHDKVRATSRQGPQPRKKFPTHRILAANPTVVGIRGLAMKVRSENFRLSAIQGIMKCIRAKGVEVIVYETSLDDDLFFNSRIVRDLAAFKTKADLIVAERMSDDLEDIHDIVFSRDKFGGD